SGQTLESRATTLMAASSASATAAEINPIVPSAPSCVTPYTTANAAAATAAPMRSFDPVVIMGSLGHVDDEPDRAVGGGSEVPVEGVSREDLGVAEPAAEHPEGDDQRVRHAGHDQCGHRAGDGVE